MEEGHLLDEPVIVLYGHRGSYITKLIVTYTLFSEGISGACSICSENLAYTRCIGTNPYVIATPGYVGGIFEETKLDGAQGLEDKVFELNN